MYLRCWNFPNQRQAQSLGRERRVAALRASRPRRRAGPAPASHDAREATAPELLSDHALARGAASLLSDYARLTAGQSAVLVYDPEVEAVSRAVGSIAASAGIAVRQVSADLDWTGVHKHLNSRCDVVLFLEAGESHHTQALLYH